MNPLNGKNIVAKILQIYAYVTAVRGAILALVFAENIEETAFIYVAAVLILSLFIYALGEIIELLDAVKQDSKGIENTKEEIQELPEI